MKRLVRYVMGRRSPSVSDQPPGCPKLLIFDFDGTIADTFDAGFAIINTLADEFGFRRLEASDLEKARDMRTLELVKFLGIPMSRMSKIARRGSEELSSRIHGIKPLPGMPEALHELKKEGFSLGIITSNTDANVATFLRNYDLEIFDFVRCSSKLLGKAHEIRTVLKTRRIAKADAFFVGDETRDVEASQKVGIRIAALTWGYNSRRSLASLNPDFLFDNAGELVAYLKGLKAGAPQPV